MQVKASLSKRVGNMKVSGTGFRAAVFRCGKKAIGWWSLAGQVYASPGKWTRDKKSSPTRLAAARDGPDKSAQF